MLRMITHLIELLPLNDVDLFTSNNFSTIPSLSPSNDPTSSRELRTRDVTSGNEQKLAMTSLRTQRVASGPLGVDDTCRAVVLMTWQLFTTAEASATPKYT